MNIFRTFLKWSFGWIILFILIIFGINAWVHQSTQGVIFSDLSSIEVRTYGIVLGAGVRGDQPSDILRDRLDGALVAYERWLVQQILVSGDNVTGAREVEIMKGYLRERGVEAEDILVDIRGLDTYSTMINARENWDIDEAIIFTQEYHLPRAIYIANHLGIDAVGYISDQHEYIKIREFEMREFLARVKDWWQVLTD